MDSVLAVIVGSIMLLLGAIVWVGHSNERAYSEWAEFAATHNCVVIGKSEFMPGKLGYKCDDGITYWK